MWQGTNKLSKIFKDYQSRVYDYMQLNQKSIIKRQEKYYDLETKKQTPLNDLWGGTEIAMKITKYLDLQMSKSCCKTFGMQFKAILRNMQT